MPPFRGLRGHAAQAGQRKDLQRAASRPLPAAGSHHHFERHDERVNTMSGICDGRVVIITGAGRGIGRGHAIEFARQGAKVVVNDLGGAVEGSGSDETPAQEVVAEIKAMGGEAVANADNVATWDGAQRLINTAVETFGTLDVLVNNA